MNTFITPITFVDNGTASLSSLSGSYYDSWFGGTYVDDSYTELPLPFPIAVQGNSYDSIWINSNGAIQVSDVWGSYRVDLSGSDAIDQILEDGNGYLGGDPISALPMIAFINGDTSLSDVLITSAADPSVFRMRWVGWQPYDAASTPEYYGLTSINVRVDFVFYRDTPNIVDVYYVTYNVPAPDTEEDYPFLKDLAYFGDDGAGNFALLDDVGTAYQGDAYRIYLGGVTDLYPEYAVPGETGEHRVKRLWNLGYL